MHREVPPSWEILPIPRYVDYGSPKSFLTVKNVAIVCRDGGPCQSVRDKSGELVGQSTITEEELTRILKESGVPSVTSVADTLPDYSGYDTLILLGNPERNSQTAKLFAAMKLSFGKWDDPHTPEHDFNDWKDLGKEGYLLKVAQHDGKNIIILAGYDYDDAKGKFYGAGRSMRWSFRQRLRRMKIRSDDRRGIDKPLIESTKHSPLRRRHNKEWRAIAGSPRSWKCKHLLVRHCAGRLRRQATSVPHSGLPNNLNCTASTASGAGSTSSRWPLHERRPLRGGSPKNIRRQAEDPCHYDPASW